jgi:hypothetical protein
MLKKDEDAAGEEFINCAAGRKAQADGEETDGVLDIFDRGNVQNRDEEDHDESKYDQSNPVEGVYTVIDGRHALVYGAADSPGLDGGPDKLVKSDVLALVLIQDLEALQRFFPAVRTENFGNVLGRHRILSMQDEGFPDPSGQGGR